MTANANNTSRSWLMDFGGMQQRQDPDKIPDIASPLLVNISLVKPGSWRKRPGLDLLATTQAGPGVQGLIEYTPYATSGIVHTVRATDLESYSPDTYSTLDAAAFSTNQGIQSVNFLNHVYHISPEDYLAYESGGAITVVGSGSDRIQGGTLAVSQQCLFVGQVTGNEDRVYFSQFDLVNNTPTHTLWSANETTLADSTRWFTLLRKNTALVAYNQFLYAFTDRECYRFDLRQAENGTAISKVFDVGCANPRAITQCNGWLIWASADGRLWIWGGSGPAMPLSWDIEDDSAGEALINAIDPDNIPLIAAGSLGNQFWFSIGDIEIFGNSIPNACIKGLITQDLSSVMWSVDSFVERPGLFANATLDGVKVLLFGSYTSDNIYQMETGLNDNTTAISAYATGKFLTYGAPFATRRGDKLYIKYRPQPVNDNFLDVRYALNGSTIYQELSTPDDGTPVTQYGVIDMYDANAATLRDMVKVLELPAEVRFRTLSWRFGNAQLDETFEISGHQMSRHEDSDLDLNASST